MSPKNYARFFGNPLFGHSVSIGFMPANWIVGIAFGPKWIALHIGPVNVFWHRPKNQRPVSGPSKPPSRHRRHDDMVDALSMALPLMGSSGEAARSSLGSDR